MKIQPNKLNITNVFEVRIRPDQWEKVKTISKFHKITYSWATRLCAFKMLDEYEHKLDLIQLENIEEKAKIQSIKKKTEKLHRHMLCIYGDEIRILIAAHKLGLTITQFIRIAIELYADSVLIPISSLELVRKGIKYVARVMEKLNQYLKTYFEDKDYRKFMCCEDGRALFIGTS